MRCVVIIAISEKVDIDELVRMVYINRCIYGDLCCVTC